MAWIILIIVLAILVIWYVSAYNGLIKTRTYVQESWSQIDVQLKRRNDLIPNLVSTTKGYANYEQGTLKKVVELRNQLTAIPADDHQSTVYHIAVTVCLIRKLSGFEGQHAVHPINGRIDQYRKQDCLLTATV